MTEVVTIDVVNVKNEHLMEYLKTAPEAVKVIKEHGAHVHGPFYTESGGAQPEVVFITKWDDVDTMEQKRKEMLKNPEVRAMWQKVMPMVLTSHNFMCTKDDKIEAHKPDPTSRMLLEHVNWVGSPIEALDVFRARLEMYAQKHPGMINVVALLVPVTFSKPGFFLLLEVKDGDLGKMIQMGKTMRDSEEAKKMSADDSKHLQINSVRLLTHIDRVPFRASQ